MTTFLSSEDIELHDNFSKIISNESLSVYVNEIVELILYDEFDLKNINQILQKYDLDITSIKEELLDVLLLYTNLVLNDNIISEKEKGNIQLLKRAFKIKEGDFYNLRYFEVEEILCRQLHWMYLNDNKIDEKESLHKVGLQEIFDLGYDQFLEFNEPEVKKALERGAYLEDLDTVYKLPPLITRSRARLEHLP